MRPKPNTSLDVIEEHIHRQQLQFQQMVGLWWTFPVPMSTLAVDLTHTTASIWGDIDSELKDLLDCPEDVGDWTQPLDIHDLQCGWPTGVVKNERRFPPLWRMQAVRSFSPQQLKQQWHVWQCWHNEIRNGKHRVYLESLFLFESAAMLRAHWNYLRERAVESLPRNNNWAQKPEFQKIRNEILFSPELLIQMPRFDYEYDESLPIPRIAPEQNKHFELSESEQRDRLDETLQAAKRLCRLTRDFDAKVKQNFKVRWYEQCYNWSLDEFICQPKTDADLDSFLNWCERCIENGFGLYLDY